MSATAEARSWPNGFSTTTRRWRPSASRSSPAAASALDDAAEEAGRSREIEHDVGAGLGAEFLQPIGQPLVGGRVLEVAGEIVCSLAQPGAGGNVDAIGEDPPLLLSTKLRTDSVKLARKSSSAARR